MADRDYDAFISYRRSDGTAVARWLRRELEAYRPPRSLRDRFTLKLRIYLDTVYERGTSDFYEQTIKPALLSSRFLLVVATPDAVRRDGADEDWIQREISDFSTGANRQNVIALRAAGDLADPLPGDIDELFPNIEIVDVRGAGRLAFLNPSRAARLSSEKLKVVAPLLGIPNEEMPRLRQEEERVQQTRLGRALGALLGVLVAVSALSVFALRSRNEANRALEDSMFATGSMVLLSTQLDGGSSGSNRVRGLLINQGCDLIDKLRLSSGREPQIVELVTCRLERALNRERLKEQPEARKEYEDAISLAAQRDGQTSRTDAGTSLVQARQAYSEYLVRQRDDVGAAAEYERLLDDARRLGKSHEYRDEFARAEGEALGQLGDLSLASGDRVNSGKRYDEAATAVGRAMKLEFERKDPETVTWLARLFRLAGEQHLQLEDTEGALERFRSSLDTLDAIESSRRTPTMELDAAVTQAQSLLAEKRRGDGVLAEGTRLDALARVERVLSVSSASTDLKQRALDLKSWLEKQSIDR